ncbi:hypothetical protein LJC27_08045 [Christensenellaceae bacterium OttesenSCG-928-M15]|nr:hypothetical protein [Christensenellaceae bacterium OttesenSCG-928-M15]
MKSIDELDLGFTDAQNYGQRANKQKFADIFVKNSYLDDLLQPQVYFLIGEKGTGKTAYATFLSNGEYKENKSMLKFLSATDYEKFYILKKQKNLDLTGYVGIWKVILLLLLSKSISENDKVVSLFNKSIISDLINTIDEYYANAFSPEIITALKVIDESEVVAKLISQHAEVGGKAGSKYEFTETKFQTNLFYIEKNFSDAIQKLKLNKNINLFIDGIDVRPDSIPYADYLECIRGLATAAWSLNTELFQNVRDSKGQLRVVLLLRPDIYGTLNLQNATNKLLDNAVFLDWRTTYQEYSRSYLYKVANKILSYQQTDEGNPEIWNSYFPWKLPSTNPNTRDYDTAFMEFLKISLSRPRDILAIMQLLQRKMKKDGNADTNEFDVISYQSNEFQNNYSEYFMSSLKDQLSFYYSSVDFEHFLHFFDLFSGSDFTHKAYLENYEKFIDYILANADEIPEFVEDPKKLLQLLYDSNTITAIEMDENDNPYFHFSYREKSNANISPKVPIGDNVSYRFHYGLYKKAKFGRF